jgi:hypothetical protein
MTDQSPPSMAGRCELCAAGHHSGRFGRFTLYPGSQNMPGSSRTRWRSVVGEFVPVRVSAEVARGQGAQKRSVTPSGRGGSRSSRVVLTDQDLSRLGTGIALMY